MTHHLQNTHTDIAVSKSPTRRIFFQLDPPERFPQASDEWSALSEIGIYARDIFNDSLGAAIAQEPALENLDDVPTFREKPKTPAITELFVEMYSNLDPMYQWLLLTMGEESAKVMVVKIVKRTRRIVAQTLQQRGLPEDGFSSVFSSKH